LGFGYAVLRAHVLPRWTGVALAAGVVLVAVSQNMPEGVQVVAAAIRDLGFLGMGASLMRAPAAERIREGTPDPQSGDLPVVAMARAKESPAFAGRFESRRGDSNPGPLHYEQEQALATGCTRSRLAPQIG
jgi:hypothetical protein